MDCSCKAAAAHLRRRRSSGRSPGTAPSRRRDCHFTDSPLPIRIETPAKGREGGVQQNGWLAAGAQDRDLRERAAALALEGAGHLSRCHRFLVGDHSPLSRLRRGFSTGEGALTAAVGILHREDSPTAAVRILHREGSLTAAAGVLHREDSLTAAVGNLRRVGSLTAAAGIRHRGGRSHSCSRDSP